MTWPEGNHDYNLPLDKRPPAIVTAADITSPPVSYLRQPVVDHYDGWIPQPLAADGYDKYRKYQPSHYGGYDVKKRQPYDYFVHYYDQNYQSSYSDRSYNMVPKYKQWVADRYDDELWKRQPSNSIAPNVADITGLMATGRIIDQYKWVLLTIAHGYS